MKNKIITILILLLLLLSSLGCIENSESKRKDQPSPNDDNGSDDEFANDVAKSNALVIAWLDTLDVDPIKLREEMGIKGKKKFVELLDIYTCLYQTATDEGNKTEYKNRVEVIINVTFDPRYHDMNEINDTQFRQDSTSYLRAWYLINKFGFNTSYYKSEIAKVIPRIDAHLSSRGINQRMAFVLYYGELGYPIAYTMDELFKQSTICARKNIENLSELEMYYITHEIFMLYDNDQMYLLQPDDIEYLNTLLPALTNQTISANNVDLLAELIMIMTYLDLTERAEYDAALDFVLHSQNPFGSFANYEPSREYYDSIGIDIDIQFYLHTTEVCLRALNEALYYGSKFEVRVRSLRSLEV